MSPIPVAIQCLLRHGSQGSKGTAPGRSQAWQLLVAAANFHCRTTAAQCCGVQQGNVEAQASVMNTEKTTTMVFGKKDVECKVEIKGQRLTNVREQVYLGVALSEDGKMECELERIGAAMRAAGAVRSQVV